MKDAVSESSEITTTERDSFEDFDFVVAAFNKAVGTGSRKGIKDFRFPSDHCFCTAFKRLDF